MRVLIDPLGPLDKTAPARRLITVEDLMTHRSGLAYVFSVPPPLGPAYGKLSLRQDQDRWLTELAKLPLAHQPGDRLTYSYATDVLGIALSRIEGKPLAEVLAERIFEPLGMSDTGFFGQPGRPATRRDHVQARQGQRAAARRDGPTAHHRSAVLHRRRGPVVDRRRLSEASRGCCSPAGRSTVFACSRRSRCG